MSTDLYNVPMKGYNPTGTAYGVYNGRVYRLCYSMQRLIYEIYEKYGSKVTCLGVLGDTSHQGRVSDHNPGVHGPDEWLVLAVDLTASDSKILDWIEDRFNDLYNRNDPRVHPYGYTHRDNEITMRDDDPHTSLRYLAGDVGHLHLSASAGGPTPGPYIKSLDDHTTLWLTDPDWFDMASKDDLKDVVTEVLTSTAVQQDQLVFALHRDDIIPAPRNAKTADTNKFWAWQSHIQQASEASIDAAEGTVALAAQVKALAGQVTAMQADFDKKFAALLAAVTPAVKKS